MRYPPHPPELDAWLAERQVSKNRLGFALGVARATVRRWLNGTSTPQPSIARVLEDLSDGRVPRSSWAPRNRKRAR